MRCSVDWVPSMKIGSSCYSSQAAKAGRTTLQFISHHIAYQIAQHEFHESDFSATDLGAGVASVRVGDR